MATGFHKPHLPFVVAQRFVDMHPLSRVGLAENKYAPWDMPTVAWQNYGELRNYPDMTARPAANPRPALCGAHSFKTPQVNPGSLYRRGRSS